MTNAAAPPDAVYHVCFSGSPECSGCNPCPDCRAMNMVLVYPVALQLMGIHPQTAMPAFEEAYGRALARLHEVMQHDPVMQQRYKTTILRARPQVPPVQSPVQIATPPKPATLPAPPSIPPAITVPALPDVSAASLPEEPTTEDRPPLPSPEAMNGYADQFPGEDGLHAYSVKPQREATIPMTAEEIASAGYITKT